MKNNDLENFADLYQQLDPAEKLVIWIKIQYLAANHKGAIAIALLPISIVAKLIKYFCTCMVQDFTHSFTTK